MTVESVKILTSLTTINTSALPFNIMIIMMIVTLPIREDPTMMRNGCLTLCQFNIPQDVLFDYERLVTMKYCQL